MRSLEAVEPPVYLVHNILVATSGVVSTRVATAAGTGYSVARTDAEWWDSWFTPVAAFVRQPRFAMSFGMIFFSLSLGLNAAGVKAADVAKIDLRPTAVRHAYNDAQIKVVKYYDNIRFVYRDRIEGARVEAGGTPAEPGPQAQTKITRTIPVDNRNSDRIVITSARKARSCWRRWRWMRFKWIRTNFH